jgi:prepilin-type N-terminal cleavage/methylation domain-containing protein
MKTEMYQGNRGFTLVELLIVVAVISILALIALPNFEDAQTRAKVAAVKNNMRTEALKVEMLQVDSNRYPLSGKWRWIILWRELSGEDDNPNEEFIKRMGPLFGPHWDLFEWEALKRNAIQDTAWVANQNDSYLFNGFGFFSPPTMVEALPYCTPDLVYTRVQWEDSSKAHWEAVERLAGDWVLISPGPDLIVETPAWLEFPCLPYRYNHFEEGYREGKLFTEYDPTNGTVSYGNIFRTQRNPSGLHADPEFTEIIETPGDRIE